MKIVNAFLDNCLRIKVTILIGVKLSSAHVWDILLFISSDIFSSIMNVMKGRIWYDDKLPIVLKT